MHGDDLGELVLRNRGAFARAAAIERGDEIFGDLLRRSAFDVVSFDDGLDFAVLEHRNARGGRGIRRQVARARSVASRS